MRWVPLVLPNDSQSTQDFIAIQRIWKVHISLTLISMYLAPVAFYREHNKRHVNHLFMIFFLNDFHVIKHEMFANIRKWFIHACNASKQDQLLYNLQNTPLLFRNPWQLALNYGQIFPYSMTYPFLRIWDTFDYDWLRERREIHSGRPLQLSGMHKIGQTSWFEAGCYNAGSEVHAISLCHIRKPKSWDTCNLVLTFHVLNSSKRYAFLMGNLVWKVSQILRESGPVERLFIYNEKNRKILQQFQHFILLSHEVLKCWSAVKF